MCAFLSVAVDARRAATLEAALRALRLEVGAQTNAAVLALFESRSVAWLVTHGGCSCDLKPTLKKTRHNARVPPVLDLLQAHAPVAYFFHEVGGDPLTWPVSEGARATTLALPAAQRPGPTKSAPRRRGSR